MGRKSARPAPELASPKAQKRLVKPDRLAADAIAPTLQRDEVTETAKSPSDRIIINLVRSPVWHHIIGRGVHEALRRYYEYDTQHAYGIDGSLRILLSPAIKHAWAVGLTGDKLHRLISTIGREGKISQHRAKSIQVSRSFIDDELKPLITHLDNTTVSEKVRWSVRTALIAVLFNYANYLAKNHYKVDSLLQ